MKKLVFALLLLALPACRYQKDAEDTAFNQFKASSSLEKYEWFKDAHANLTALQAQVKGKQEQINHFRKAYEGVPMKDWDRFDKQNLAQFEQELFGLTSAFNKLAAEYNSNMSKFNYSYASSTTPEGSDLPRSIIQYK